MRTLRQQHSRRVPRLGGVVTIRPVRSRLPDEDGGYSISWHSPGGDLCWLSPRVPNEEAAEAAAAVLANFAQAVVVR